MFDNEDESDAVKKQTQGMLQNLDTPYKQGREALQRIVSGNTVQAPVAKPMGPTPRELEEAARVKAIADATALREAGQLKASSPAGAHFLGEQAQQMRSKDLARQLQELKDLEDVGAFESPDSEVNVRAAKLRALLGK